MQLDFNTALICAAALFVGGFTKGVAGLGLPMVAIPLLTLAVDLHTAVVLLALPTLIANVFQSFQRGAFAPTMRRFWPLMATMVPMTAVGAMLLVSLEPRILYVALGLVILVFTVLTRAAPSLQVGRPLERVLSPVVGAVSGLIGGASSLFGPPIMVYLLSLRLDRTEYIATVSLLYLISAALFLISLVVVGGFGGDAALNSTLALIPVFGGMWVGQLLGARLSKRLFERTLDALYVLAAFTFFYKAFS